MFHLKQAVQHQIKSVILERQEKNGLEVGNDKVFNKKRSQPDKIEHDDLYAKELRPQIILEAIKNAESNQSAEMKALLKELEGRKNSELNKKFSNFVNKIKKQMLIVNL